ncbi:MAG TPA: hypothetical protein VJL80_06445 [Aeromicrobium sp.]|nr:hypothetical protein [Aeromicrobium sp.]HKY57658.1 hypothetical protein [Aeromicrobium sp.]
MTEVGSAYVSILPSARGFGRRLQSQVGPESDRAGSGIGKSFGKAFALAGAGLIGAQIGGFLKDSIGAASDLQQSIGGVQAVFGRYAAQVQRDSKKAAQALGLSANEYNELITVSGALLKNNGIKDFTGASRNLLTVGADLAATFGGSTTEAVEALNAAMRGESDPIERYGISLNETAVNAVLAAKGQDKLEGAALQTAKAQARLSLIQKQSADAQGAFARESDTLAGQQQRLGAQWENMKATLGSALLPVLTDVFGFINSTALPAIKDFAKLFQGSGGASGALTKFGTSSGQVGERIKQLKATFISVFNSVRSTVQSAVSIVTSLWRIFGDSLRSSISRSLQATMNILRGAFLIIEGLFKVVAAVLKGDWSGAWEGIKTIARGALTLLKGMLQTGMNAVKTVISLAGDAIVAVFNGLWNRVVATAKALPGQIVKALGDLGKLLYNAGRELIAGLIDGIKSKLGDVKGAIGDIAGTVKDFFPGSPVKEGPLRSWNNGGAGKRLVGLLADGLGQTSPLDAAVSGLASRIAAPSFATAGVAGAAAGGGMAGQRLYLVLDDGTRFGAYVDARADSRVDLARADDGMTERAFG